MDTNITKLLESARMGLRTTFRERAHLPGSPWFAYLGQYGGIIVARTDDPEHPIPAEWRQVCRVRNDAPDDSNMSRIAAILPTMALPMRQGGAP